PWVQSAPGFPCALCFIRGSRITQSSGTSCRENANSHPHRCLTIESDAPARHCVERKRRLVRRSSKSEGGSNPCLGKPQHRLLRGACHGARSRHPFAGNGVRKLAAPFATSSKSRAR